MRKLRERITIELVFEMPYWNLLLIIGLTAVGIFLVIAS